VTGESGWRGVNAHYSNVYQETAYIRIKDVNSGKEQTIISNLVHPFFAQVGPSIQGGKELSDSSEGHYYQGEIENGRWVDASHLRPGYKLLTNEGSWASVVDVSVVAESLKAYNLKIDQYQTYFVRSSDVGNISAIWVHNNCDPYDPRAIRDELVDRYGADNVRSTTVPPLNKPNVRLAGSEKTFTLPDGATARVVFDQRGFPIFDDIARVDLQLNASDFVARSYNSQLTMATRALRDNIQRGVVSGKNFTAAQIRAINSGRSKIPGFTWHHHQRTGRMQLVPTTYHNGARHVGWESMHRGQ